MKRNTRSKSLKHAIAFLFCCFGLLVYTGASVSSMPATCKNCGTQDGCSGNDPMMTGWEFCDINWGSQPPCSVWGSYGSCRPE